MKQVQILIDSACDMQQPEAERLGVTLLPLRTSFDGEVFLDGVDLSHEAFFEKLTQKGVKSLLLCNNNGFFGEDEEVKKAVVDFMKKRV